MQKTAQRSAQTSEDITDIMVREFDKVYIKFAEFEAHVDERFEAIDRRLDDIEIRLSTLELRVNRLDEEMHVVNGNLLLIMRHLGIPEGQALL